MKAKIFDIIDFEKVNSLLEGFNKTTDFVTAILDLEGNVLSQSGWRQICTEFHRINPETSKRCTISDTVLAGKMAEGEKYHFYQCLNGLVDVAVPIVIKGEHIANLFSGQFFFEEPDRSFFIQQAAKFGFEEGKYLKLLDKVPVLSKDKVKVAMEFLLEMTQLITEISYQKLEQTELNEALLKSNLLIDNIVDNSPFLIYVADLDGQFQMVNNEMEKLFKLPKEKFIGNLRQNIMPKEIADQHRNNDLMVIRTKKLITIEEENQEADGKHFYLTQKFPLFNKNGEVYAVGGISTDITERKNAEAIIKHERDKAQLYFNIAGVMIVVLNSHGEIEKINKKGGEILGYDDSSDLIGANWFETCIPKSVRDGVRSIFGKLMAGQLEPTEYYENPVLTKSGTKRFVLFHNTYLYDSNSKITGVLFSGKDITDRKNAQEALQRSEYVLNEAQRISKIGGWEYDVESGETYFSDEVFNIYGLTKNKMFKAEDGIKFYHPDDRPLVSDSFTKAITQGIPYDIEVRFINALGENRWIRTAGKPVYKNEKIVKILGNLMDVTERKLAEEKILTQMAELKRYNATMIDRELRMIQLKQEINEYCRQMNLPAKYSVPCKKK